MIVGKAGRLPTIFQRDLLNKLLMSYIDERDTVFRLLVDVDKTLAIGRGRFQFATNWNFRNDGARAEFYERQAAAVTVHSYKISSLRLVQDLIRVVPLLG